MDIFLLLEAFASTTCDQASINELIENQPTAIKNALNSKNSLELKKLLCDVNSLPDRCAVVQHNLSNASWKLL